MAKWFKAIGVVVTLCLVTLGGAALWWRSEISILSGTEALEGERHAIPVSKSVHLPPLSKGTDDWTCWRGASGDGRSTVTGIRKDWSGGLEKRWSVDYLCQGDASATWSAPVVLGDRVLLCGRNDDEDLLFCLLNNDGSLLWKSGYEAKAKSSHGTGPRATPFIDDDRIYTFGRNGDLVCWKVFDGSKVWQQNVDEHGGKEPQWGYSSSPIVWRNLVFVHAGGGARVISFDKMTGALAWKSGEGPAGYAPLVITELEGTECLLSFHGTGLAALEAATGKELWNLPWETDYDVNATTPVVDGNRVFISSGYGTGCALVEMTKQRGKFLYRNKEIASHHSDPYIIDGFLYGYTGQSFQNRGSFKCIELSSGKLVWSTNEMGWGTCVLVDGHFICCDIKGNLFLAKPNPQKFVMVSQVKLALGPDVKPAWTIPVVANGLLYLRYKQTLIAYDLK